MYQDNNLTGYNLSYYLIIIQELSCNLTFNLIIIQHLVEVVLSLNLPRNVEIFFTLRLF